MGDNILYMITDNAGRCQENDDNTYSIDFKYHSITVYYYIVIINLAHISKLLNAPQCIYVIYTLCQKLFTSKMIYGLTDYKQKLTPSSNQVDWY